MEETIMKKRPAKRVSIKISTDRQKLADINKLVTSLLIEKSSPA